MNKITLLICFGLLYSLTYSQSIYKGLKKGMTKDQAKQEYRSNKSQYKKIDLGNGFLYRTYRRNFEYDGGELVGVLLTPKGSAFGQSYSSAKNHLIHTRNFFENLGYETFIDNKWWNAPHNYVRSDSKYGLVLRHKEKDKIIQMYPIELQSNYLVKLMVWHYDTWMGYYNKNNKVNKEKVKDSGF